MSELPKNWRFRYKVTTIKIPEDGEHECSGNIVSIIQSTYNTSHKAWYITALVQSPVPANRKQQL